MTSKKIVTVSTVMITGMHVINKYIEYNISPILPSVNEKKYIWRNMKIIYTEKGNDSNPPLLLLHNLSPSSSKEEWSRIDKLLAKKFHIFELDLPGCGKSDKPNETYVNYMFVQLLTCFIKEIIGKKTNICAAAFSSSFTLMTARIEPDIVDKIIVINPTSIYDLIKPITKRKALKKKILDMPILGTFLYNCKMCRPAIADDYKYVYLYNDKNVSRETIDTSYYNAHYNKSSGKYLYGSMISNYTNINIIHALPKIKNEIYLIGSGNHKTIIQEYKKYNKYIHSMYVSNCKLLPHLEIPQTIVEKINAIFN